MTLADYLTATGTSRAAFARAIGVKHISVTRYLAGRVPEPRVMEKIALATGCKVTANDFFGISTGVSPDAQRGSPHALSRTLSGVR